MKVTLWSLLIAVFLSGCDKIEDQAPASSVPVKPVLDRAKDPLVIAPMIEGLDYCDDVLLHGKSTTFAHRYELCEKHNFSLVPQLQQALSVLEPQGPQGSVKVGYTYVVSLLSLYRKTANGWVLEQEKIDKIFQNIKLVGRPAVLYLMMNHFDTQNRLSADLLKNKDNLMLMADGKPPVDSYFETSIIPFTLSTDATIPVNRYRFTAYKAILDSYNQLSEDEKSIIHGFSLIGETHHMYPDFKGGTGQFKDIKLTDYSDRSIQGFQQWLQDKHGSIASLNTYLNTNFENWQGITAPDKDIRSAQLSDFSQHLDSYAHGKLPVFGWIWEKKKDFLKAVKVYVDGIYIADADLHLNRLDVYQALSELETPKVGFRYELDFSQLAPGIHKLQLVAETSEGDYELTHRKFVYVDRSQSAPKPIPTTNSNEKLESAANLEQLQFYVDHPKPLQDVYYNPLAKEWHFYRSAQVEQFITHVWSMAVERGIEKAKLFSHQIVPYINGSWNTVLFATQASVSLESSYLPGVTVYGGATDSEVLQSVLPAIAANKYAVPEYHSQQYKSYQQTLMALNSHFYRKASFVTPYYLSIIPKQSQGKSEHLKFLLSPENSEYGSDFLYRAIQDMAKR